MRAIAAKAAWGLGWIAIAVAVSLAVVVVTDMAKDAEATHNPGKSYLQRGLLDVGVWCAYWYSYPSPKHPCWHPSNSGVNTAIDYNFGSDPYDDVGRSTYLYWTGASSQHFKLRTLTYCKGVEARIYDRYVGNDTYFRGQVRYLHINPRSGVNGLIPSSNFTWLGGIHGGPEVSGCGWQGPHLHQDANVGSTTPFYTNWYGSHPNTHSHTICWSGTCP